MSRFETRMGLFGIVLACGAEAAAPAATTTGDSCNAGVEPAGDAKLHPELRAQIRDEPEDHVVAVVIGVDEAGNRPCVVAVINESGGDVTWEQGRVVSANVSLASLAALARRSDVVDISPEFENTPPPGD